MRVFAGGAPAPSAWLSEGLRRDWRAARPAEAVAGCRPVLARVQPSAARRPNAREGGGLRIRRFERASGHRRFADFVRLEEPSRRPHANLSRLPEVRVLHVIELRPVHIDLERRSIRDHAQRAPLAGPAHPTSSRTYGPPLSAGGRCACRSGLYRGPRCLPARSLGRCSSCSRPDSATPAPQPGRPGQTPV